MTRDLRNRSRRHGSKSAFAGDEPKWHEATEHWQVGRGMPLPKGSPWREKQKRHHQKLGKRAMKLKRKDRINKHADKAAYEAQLAAPWSIYVAVKEGEH